MRRLMRKASAAIAATAAIVAMLALAPAAGAATSCSLDGNTLNVSADPAGQTVLSVGEHAVLDGNTIHVTYNGQEQSCGANQPRTASVEKIAIASAGGSSPDVAIENPRLFHSTVHEGRM